MNSMFGGVVLSLVAGVLNGSFATPTKYTKKWQWENIWSVWAVAAMLIFPWLLVLATIPNAASVYSNISAKEIALLTIFGLGFGLAQIFFGLGIAAVGIALNFAIAIGISTVEGSLVPLILQHPEEIHTAKGQFVFLGVLIMVVGIVLSAVAGREKERNLRGNAPASGGAAKTISFAAGLTLCILAGIGSPLGNFGLAFCTSTVNKAVEFGASLTNKYNVIWAPLYMASLVPYFIYCIYLWRKNHSFHLFGEKGTGVYWFYGIIMAALWMGSSAIYGISAARIGYMGPVIGWPLFMSIIIITSSVWGYFTGEWTGAGRKAGNSMILAIVFLILGFATLAYSGSLG